MLPINKRYCLRLLRLQSIGDGGENWSEQKAALQSTSPGRANLPEYAQPYCANLKKLTQIQSGLSISDFHGEFRFFGFFQEVVYFIVKVKLSFHNK